MHIFKSLYHDLTGEGKTENPTQWLDTPRSRKTPGGCPDMAKLRLKNLYAIAV